MYRDGFGQEFCEASRVQVHEMRVEPNRVRDCELRVESRCELSSIDDRWIDDVLVFLIFCKNNFFKVLCFFKKWKCAFLWIHNQVFNTFFVWQARMRVASRCELGKTLASRRVRESRVRVQLETIPTESYFVIFVEKKTKQFLPTQTPGERPERARRERNRQSDQKWRFRAKNPL